MSVLTTQWMVSEESTYGTPVTPDHAFEFESETVKPNMGRITTAGHRKNQRVDRADRTQPYIAGYSGTVTLAVPTKGCGILLKHTFGTSSVATVVDSNYVQTHVLGTKTGRFLTSQFNKPLNDGTAQPHTYHGGKILAAEFSMEKYGKLMMALDFDHEDGDTSTSLATPSYPSSMDFMPWTLASMTLGGSAIEFETFNLRVVNGMNVARHYLRGSTLKKEPLQNAREGIEFKVKMSHTAMTTYNRVVAQTTAGIQAALVATFTGPTAHAGTTLPSMVFTVPVIQLDTVDGVNIGSFDEINGEFSGVGKADASNVPITCTYTTTDATVV